MLAVLSVIGLAWLTLMVVRPHSGGRTGVLTQLQRPASAPPARVGPGPVNAVVTVAGLTVAVHSPVNHAAQPQALSLHLTHVGAPVDGARVTVSYSMPSMNMPSVLTTTLHARGAGTYEMRSATLAMPGDWLLSVRIAPPRGRPVLVALADRMPR